jgi:hypothetical protein
VVKAGSVGETGQETGQALELEPSASWVVSQKIAQGTKSFVVFAAFG